MFLDENGNKWEYEQLGVNVKCEAHESDVDIGIPAVMLPHDDVASLIIREEYHLTAKDGNLHSKVMLLNGEELSVTSSCDIPLLEA
ncbi:hypothetical protein CTI12_AA033810 [Artemisia annua]|uniref:Uncharacterized protein n=1 Tax=Artemisia annua TaxID=35608 RepID=A0A2U1QG42_ARTAN|nr:hypothetical protein CTI12_AA033810 [Artemisia annua]